MLSKKDFTFFHQVFSREVNLLLPIGGDVYFWEQGGKWLPHKRAEELLGQGVKKLAALCASLESAAVNSVLVIPVAAGDGDRVAVLAAGIDPGLLQKMSPEWLQELRGKVQAALVRAKQSYIYPETGLYSFSLLRMFWEEQGNASPGAFFLAGVPDNAKRSTSGLVKLAETAFLFEAAAGGPVVYLGGRVFGLFQRNLSRENSLNFARRLQGRLKREGARQVHIGIALARENEDNSPDRLLAESWKALETAEQRGPFGLCEASSLHPRNVRPFARPGGETVKKMRKKWQGLTRFSVLLLRVEEKAGSAQAPPLARLVAERFGDRYSFVPVHSGECYFVLPGVSGRKAMEEAGAIKEALDAALQPNQLAIGVNCWPFRNFSRTESLANCRKALLHGGFFGPGSVTLFDHVSLNVSGDYYFDEGDYRQAVRDYKAGLDIRPGEVNLLNSLGVALTELNRLAEAVGCFDRVLQKEPGNFMALVNKGFALRMQKKEKDALACLARAERCREFASSPVAADILLQLGRLYCAMGQYENGVKVLERLRAQHAETAGHLLCRLLGEAYAEVGRNDSAVQILQEAIRYNPHDAQSISILGYLYGIEGQGDDIALALCTQAVSMDSSSLSNWCRLARIRLKMRDGEGAAAAVKEAQQLNRKAVEPVFLAGEIFRKTGNTKQAMTMFRRALRMAPGHTGALRALREMNNEGDAK